MEDILSIIPKSASAYTDLLQAKNAYDAAIAAGQGEIAEAKAGAVRDLISQAQQNRDPKYAKKLDTDIKRQVADLYKFGSQYIQKETKSTAQQPPEDEVAKAAMINAALAGFNARVDEASQRGVSVPPQLVSSIQSLIGTGRIKEAADLQEQTLGPVESATERRTRLVQEQETQKAEKAKELESKGIISTINRYVDAKGNPTQDLDDATGYFEEAATGIAKVAPFLGTQSPKSRASQQELSREIEKSIMAAAANLKPVSNFELKQLESRRPQISDPPEVWANYLSGVRDVIQKDKTRTDSEVPRELGEIQRATDLLRSKLKK